jgi:hypothetical protein
MNRVLGLFILFQLVYLPIANLIKLVPLGIPESTGELNDDIQLRGQAFVAPVQAVADAAGTGFARWGELTGQAQGWSLFAPVFGHQAALPVVELYQIRLRSQFVPADANYYFRAPSSACRLFNFEYRLALLYWNWDSLSYWDRRGEYAKSTELRVRRQNRSMLAYMRWKMDRFLSANPLQGAPARVALLAEIIPSPPMNDPWAMREPPHRGYDIALWECMTPTPAGMMPVQSSNVFSGVKWLPIEGEP